MRMNVGEYDMVSRVVVIPMTIVDGRSECQTLRTMYSLTKREILD